MRQKTLRTPRPMKVRMRVWGSARRSRPRGRRGRVRTATVERRRRHLSGRYVRRRVSKGTTGSFARRFSRFRSDEARKKFPRARAGRRTEKTPITYVLVRVRLPGFRSQRSNGRHVRARHALGRTTRDAPALGAAESSRRSTSSESGTGGGGGQAAWAVFFGPAFAFRSGLKYAKR